MNGINDIDNGITGTSINSNDIKINGKITLMAMASTAMIGINGNNCYSCNNFYQSLKGK